MKMRLRGFGNTFLRVIGRRGAFLLFWAFLWVNQGLRWTKSPLPPDLFYVLLKAAPPSFWGSCFILTGLIMGVGGIWKRLEDLSFFVSAYLAGFLAGAILIEYLWPGMPGPGATGLSALITYTLYIVFIYIISGWQETPVAVIIKQEETQDGH